MRPARQEARRSGPFQGSSEAREAFRPHKGAAPAKSMKPRDSAAATGLPFAGSSTTRDDYPGWEAAPREARKPQHAPPPGLPFEGASTYQSEFPGQRAEPARPFKPRESRVTGGKFE